MVFPDEVHGFLLHENWVRAFQATDDFFKIAGYEKELAALIKASPEEDIAVIQKEAARIIRDTFPNYD